MSIFRRKPQNKPQNLDENNQLGFPKSFVRGPEMSLSVKKPNATPIKRTLWKMGEQTSYGSHATRDDKDPDLISSQTEDGFHAPVIDCDYEIEAVPSSTPGHFHLLIDRKLTWEQYQALLEGFHKAGLIEDGWYRAALRDKRSYVRRPGVYKPFEDLVSRITETGTLFPES